MEKLGQIVRAAQSAGSNALTLPGTKQLDRDSLIQLGNLLRQMSAAMPHQEYAEQTTEVFLLTFEDLALEFGISLLETALRRFLSRTKFFPHPSEVREELEAMAVKAKQEAAAALPKIGCEKCLPGGEGFAGFLYEQKPGGPRIVTPCECRLAREKAKREAASAN